MMRKGEINDNQVIQNRETTYGQNNQTKNFY